MKYCTRCVLPESHESIAFDEEGVCNICRQAEVKHNNIDWNARKEMLLAICNRYRGKGRYDCIIPFSGGKDSTFQLWYVVEQLKLKPLVVRFNHWGYRPLVEENNIRTFKKLGVDILEYTPSWKVVKQFMLVSLKETGDFCWHCHTGVFAHTMQIAVLYKIPLVIWGEPSSEYRSYHTAEELEELDARAFDQMINLGINTDKMYSLLGGMVDKRDLEPFQFPTEEELSELHAKAIYLGNYMRWDIKRQVAIIKEKLGWQDQAVEGIPPEYDYEKIECRWQGIRDYCKYLKRGHGRTNHLACIDIRNGELSREEGLRLCEEYDGKRPASLEQFLSLLSITEEEFEQILLSNSVIDWGFDHNKIETGPVLPDMCLWDTIV
jgi:N-acetyl sugar amidotransferase